MEKGWVKLHRQMFENKLWLSESFTKAQAWVDLFANACHKPNSFWVRGNEIKLNRGQIGWSEITMSKRWRWSRNKVRRFLTWLEDERQVEQQKNPITSIITILNYDIYQADETTERQQKDNRRNTNKNDKNDKNEKKEDIVAEATDWNFKEELEKLRVSPESRKDLKIIALYWKKKGWEFENKKQFESALKRELRPAKSLCGYQGTQIAEAIKYCESEYKVWTLETCHKRITDLTNKKQ